jgi:hypothetical protein
MKMMTDSACDVGDAEGKDLDKMMVSVVLTNEIYRKLQAHPHLQVLSMSID